MATLNWIGKEKVINHHLNVPFRTLKHNYTYKDGKTLTDGTRSENKIIHGDNLEALKSLLPEYEGKIKCVYIDPPYNTGNEDWIYNDNVNHPKIKKWLGQVVGTEGEDLTRHDKWLCMMYPRIKLLHKLLSDDGFIFISLDDNEIHALKYLLNEIFGEKNFFAQIIVQSNKRGQTYKQIAKTHEYLVCYSKSEKGELNKIVTDGGHLPYEDKIGKFSIRELRNRNPKFGRFNRPNLFYPIYINPHMVDKNGFVPVSLQKDSEFNIEVLPLNSRSEESCWRWGSKKLSENTLNHSTKTIFGRQKQSGKWGVYEKYRDSGVTAKTIWDDTDIITEQGTKLLVEMGLRELFPYPKPVKLIQKVIQLIGDSECICLDSFAGSGTTAHAVMQQNLDDGGDRKFILIELEDYAESVTAERVKRVIDGYGTEAESVEGTHDEFEFLELGDSLFNEDNYINENQPIPDIRKYVYYAETKTNSGYSDNPHNEFYLGKRSNVGYYFYYKKDSTTTLGLEFASKISIKAEQYIVYADKCSLSEKYLNEHNIVFKKIPRDINKI